MATGGDRNEVCWFSAAMIPKKKASVAMLSGYCW